MNKSDSSSSNKTSDGKLSSPRQTSAMSPLNVVHLSQARRILLAVAERVIGEGHLLNRCPPLPMEHWTMIRQEVLVKERPFLGLVYSRRMAALEVVQSTPLEIMVVPPALICMGEALLLLLVQVHGLSAAIHSLLSKYSRELHLLMLDRSKWPRLALTLWAIRHL